MELVESVRVVKRATADYDPDHEPELVHAKHSKVGDFTSTCLNENGIVDKIYRLREESRRLSLEYRTGQVRESNMFEAQLDERRGQTAGLQRQMAELQRQMAELQRQMAELQRQTDELTGANDATCKVFDANHASSRAAQMATQDELERMIKELQAELDKIRRKGPR